MSQTHCESLAMTGLRAHTSSRFCSSHLNVLYRQGQSNRLTPFWSLQPVVVVFSGGRNTLSHPPFPAGVCLHPDSAHPAGRCVTLR